jgi:hypothetical protein
MTTDNEVLRKLTEKNKIADFAMQVLKMDERRAEAFTKICGDFLKWDGTLQFKTASGAYVAADDPQSTGFFQREFDYLIPAKTAEEQHADIDPALIELAKDGNWTARGQIFRALHKGNDAETTAAVAKLLKGETREHNTDGTFKADDKTPNPWSANGWNISKQGAVYKSSPELAERLAKSAGSHIGATRPAKSKVA